MDVKSHKMQHSTRYYIYDNFFDLIYHDPHRGRFGFQFEHVENNNLFYLFCEIDIKKLPRNIKKGKIKQWMEEHREDLANLAEDKHAKRLSQKHQEVDSHTGALRYDVEISTAELTSIGLSLK
jgi:hypothetical protein